MLDNPYTGIDVETNAAAFTRFPEALVNMTELRDIRMSGLGIYGTIPESIFTLKNLVILYDFGRCRFVLKVSSVVANVLLPCQLRARKSSLGHDTSLGGGQNGHDRFVRRNNNLILSIFGNSS